MITSQKADLILYNANIFTLDPKRPRAELVAVKGEKIIWVGHNDKLGDLKGQKTEKSNARERP